MPDVVADVERSVVDPHGMPLHGNPFESLPVPRVYCIRLPINALMESMSIPPASVARFPAENTRVAPTCIGFVDPSMAKEGVVKKGEALVHASKVRRV